MSISSRDSSALVSAGSATAASVESDATGDPVLQANLPNLRRSSVAVRCYNITYFLTGGFGHIVAIRMGTLVSPQ